MAPAQKNILFFLFSIIVLIGNLVIILIFPKIAFADVNPQDSYAFPSAKKFIKTQEAALNGIGNLVGEQYVGKFTLGNTLFGASQMIMGSPGALDNDPELQKIIKESSAIGISTKLIASTYSNPPASTAYYMMDLAQRIGVPTSYAQGIGFGGLTPILPIWKAFRNIAYGLIVVVLVIIGLMIMFRVKIDPHTVISVQQALPRVIISLVLITFSYAIAGLLIDLMYLVILLAISVVIGALPASKALPTIAQAQSTYLTGGLFGLSTPLFSLLNWDQWEQIHRVAISLGVGLGAAFFGLPGIGSIIGAGITASILGGVLGSVGGTGLAEDFVGGAASPIVYFIIALGLLFMFIRILMMLMNAYVQIVVSIIFAPIQILFDAFPSGGNNFSSWLKNLIANLAIFPTVVILLVLGQAIQATIAETSGAFAGFWTPPLVPGWTPHALKFVLGFGIITLIPAIAGGIKETLEAKPALPIGIGAPLAPFLSGAQTALATGSQFYFFGHTLDFIKGLGGTMRGGGGHPPEKRK